MSLESLLPSSQTTVFYLAGPHVAPVISFIRALITLKRGLPYWPYYITKPNILTPSHWELSFHHMNSATAPAKSLQLCDSVWSHPWDSPGKNTGVGCHFLLQWIKVKVKSLSHVWLFETPWTAAYQAPPSMGFSSKEYRSGVPLPSPIWILGEHKYSVYSNAQYFFTLNL